MCMQCFIQMLDLLEVCWEMHMIASGYETFKGKHLLYVHCYIYNMKEKRTTPTLNVPLCL